MHNYKAIGNKCDLDAPKAFVFLRESPRATYMYKRHTKRVHGAGWGAHEGDADLSKHLGKFGVLGSVAPTRPYSLEYVFHNNVNIDGWAYAAGRACGY